MTPPASGDVSLLKRLAGMAPEKRAAWLAKTAKTAEVSVEQLIVRISGDWRFVGRPKQQPPSGEWTYWLVRAGRGFGKTIAGAQWAKQMAVEHPGARISLVGPTLADTRETMVEGESGLLSILPDSLLRGGRRASAWNRGPVELYLDNGSMFRGFSSVEPDRLRGPQHHYTWGDEVASWKDAQQGDKLETTWSNAKLGTRLGDHPRFCLTTTPKANRLMKDILSIPGLRLVVGSSYENRDNLSEAWWNEVVAPYEGTRLGKQEILAMMLEDVEGALWSLATIEGLRLHEDPHDVAGRLARIVVGVDPNVSSDEASNSAGIVVVGADGTPGNGRKGYVLADRTVSRGGPREWAQAAIDAYHDFSADRIVAEKNQGGEMVELTLHTVDSSVPVKLVSASRGKRTRAEPVAAAYAGSDTVKPRVFHVGLFPELEEEMTSWTPESESPDRMDALVWGLTELIVGGPSGTYSTGVAKGTLPRTLVGRTMR